MKPTTTLAPIALLALALLAAPLAAEAQQGARVYRIGLLSEGPHPCRNLSRLPCVSSDGWTARIKRDGK